MRTKTGPKGSADKPVKEIMRKTLRKFSAEEKIRIVLDGLRREGSISELYHHAYWFPAKVRFAPLVTNAARVAVVAFGLIPAIAPWTYPGFLHASAPRPFYAVACPDAAGYHGS